MHVKGKSGERLIISFLSHIMSSGLLGRQGHSLDKRVQSRILAVEKVLGDSPNDRLESYRPENDRPGVFD